MSGLLDDVLKAPTNTGGRPCLLDRLLDDLADTDLGSDLEQLLWNPAYERVDTTVIVRNLADRGHHVGASSMQRHRRGDCRTCEPRRTRIQGENA